VQPLGAPQPRDGAARHLKAFAAQLAVHLAGAVDAELLGVDAADVRPQLLVASCAPRWRPRLAGVLRAGGDLQHAADRLDPKVTMRVEKGGYPAGRPSCWH
jgi:hypothetical protein